jgi:hypothetical protein
MKARYVVYVTVGGWVLWELGKVFAVAASALGLG